MVGLEHLVARARVAGQRASRIEVQLDPLRLGGERRGERGLLAAPLAQTFALHARAAGLGAILAAAAAALALGLLLLRRRLPIARHLAGLGVRVRVRVRVRVGVRVRVRLASPGRVGLRIRG